MKKTLISSVLLFALPSLAFAQNLDPLRKLIQSIGTLVAMLVPILVTMALIAFFWGLVRYLWPSGGKSNVAGAKSLMIWGLLSLFVMVSVWGIVRMAQNALNIDPNTSAPSPSVLVPGGSNSSVINPNNNAGSAQNIYNPAFNGQWQP